MISAASARYFISEDTSASALSVRREASGVLESASSARWLQGVPFGETVQSDNGFQSLCCCCWPIQLFGHVANARAFAKDRETTKKRQWRENNGENTEWLSVWKAATHVPVKENMLLGNSGIVFRCRCTRNNFYFLLSFQKWILL